MDGVIIDSEPQHFSAWYSTFKNHGVTITKEQYHQFSGRRDPDIIRHFMGISVSDAVISNISDEKQATFRRIIVAGHMTAMPGVIPLIHSLHDLHVKQALASSSPTENITLILDLLKLKPYFPTIVSAIDVTHGKPDPEAFLLAASRLNVDPVQVVVIEDAVAGVDAAKSAGMKVIAVTSTNPSEKLADADLVVDSIEDISFTVILKLIGHS